MRSILRPCLIVAAAAGTLVTLWILLSPRIDSRIATGPYIDPHGVQVATGPYIDPHGGQVATGPYVDPGGSTLATRPCIDPHGVEAATGPCIDPAGESFTTNLGPQSGRDRRPSAQAV